MLRPSHCRRFALRALTAAAPLLVAACGAPAPTPAAAHPPAPTGTVSSHTTTAGAGSRPRTSTRAAGSATKPHGTTTSTGAAVAIPCRSFVDSQTTSQLAARVITIPVRQSSVAQVAPLTTAGFGGLLLFGSHTPPGFAAALARLQADAPAGTRVLVMVDQEGGSIARMADLIGPTPWPRTVTATMSVAGTRALGRRVGTALRTAGVTMDLAPVVDLDAGLGPDARHPDGSRSYSADPVLAARYALAFADGLRAAGVTPVVKHFPGLGRATANTDMAPATVPGLPELEGLELRPFEAAVADGIPAVMMSTAVIPGVSRLPAALSSNVTTGLLRGTLGFNGLVLTDSLSGQAVAAAGFTVPAAAVQAIEAGNDMVMFGDADTTDVATQAHAVRDALVTAVSSGRLSRARLEDAAARVLAAAGGCPAVAPHS